MKQHSYSYLANLFILLRRTVYVLLGKIDSYLIRNDRQIVILCYHSIANDNWTHSVKIDEFKKQIAYLKKQYDFVPLKDLELFLEGKKNFTKSVVVLTFDDGYRNILSIKDFLVKNKIHPAIFIIADQINVDKKELDTNILFLTRDQILELHKAGWIIGSHSLTHRDFYKLTKDEIKYEVQQSKEKLQKELGVSISYFAYPKGKYTKEIVSNVKKAGYTLGLSMDDNVIKNGLNKYTLPRIGINCTHTFNEFKYSMSPSVIRFRRLIKNSFLNRFL